MQRTVSKDLKVWKDSTLRKPLLVRGARQVGKTYVLRELGKSYSHFLEANFEESREIHQFFEGSLDPVSICEKLSNYFGVKIAPGETLLFFDEIHVNY